MSSTNTYVKRLSENPFFATSRVHAVVSEARMQLLSGGVAIAFAVFLMGSVRSDRRKREQMPDEYLTMEALDKRIQKVRDVQIKSDLIAGAITVFTAVMTIVAYRPTNTEASQAALLTYLKEKGVVEDDFMAVVKNVRPYRINTLNI